MAAEFGEELITCTICLEHFTNPKTLTCLHTFCETCLQRHREVYQTQRRALPAALPCPTCREITLLPENGLFGLRTDFKISKIIDFMRQVSTKKLLCDVCLTVRQDTKAAFYCRDCCKHFCDDCIFRHRNTEVFDAHVVKEHNSEKAMKMVCKEHEKEMEPLRYFCQGCETAICALCAMTEHMLHNLTDLDTGKARNSRLKKLRDLSKKVAVQVTQIEGFLKKLADFETTLSSSYENTQEKIKERVAQILKQVQAEEENLGKALKHQYEGKLGIVATERENLTHFLDKLKNMKDLAEKTIDTDEEQPFFEVSNDLIRELKRVSQIQFLNPDDFSEVKCKFDLTLPEATPSVGYLGEENLSTNLHFMSRVPIQLLNKVTTANLDWPSDVALMQNGNIVVADTENYQLKIFDSKGSPTQILAAGETKPAGVVVTKVQTIAVTDILERCVKIFAENGKLLFEFGHDLFHSPAGIAVNSLGEYIVSDIGQNAVTVHDSQGNLLARLGTYGTEDMAFNGPWYVATNDQNDIIVSDMGNHCVKIFGYQLQLLCKIENPDGIMCPSGIDVDLQGNLLVCDGGSNCISMYTATGHLVAHILTEDDGINSPHGITVNDSGKMVLTQCPDRKSTKHELRIYQLYE